MPSTRHALDAASSLDEDATFECSPMAAPVGGYRVAGDLEVRSKELEQELLQTKMRMRELERKVYAARRTVCRRRGLAAVAYGGVGAAIANVVAIVVYEAFGVPVPGVYAALLVLGFVFGGLVGMRWEKDDNFPPAPRPRGVF